MKHRAVVVAVLVSGVVVTILTHSYWAGLAVGSLVAWGLGALRGHRRGPP